MKRGVKFIGIIVSLLLCLSGCASIPNLTDEQESMVSEYAAALMLKYDSANHSRLVETETFLNAYTKAWLDYDTAKKKYYDELQAEEDKRREENASQEAANQGTVNQTTSNRGDGYGGATVVDNTPLEAVLGLKDFTIQYAGNDLLDSYPEDASDFQGYITAASGSKLLIVYFNVTNNSSSDKEVNIAGLKPSFKFSINGSGYRSNMVSILDDDMSGFIGTFRAGETKRLVLVNEVKNGTTISSLTMRVVNGSESVNKVLK